MAEMRDSLRRVLTGFIALLALMIGGAFGYMALADASFVDALFMVVITIFSVGYEEAVRVDTPLLKAYTIVFIVTGCSALLYIVGGLIQMGTEGEIDRALGARRMSRGIDSLRDHTILCGFGRMGQILAHELLAAESPFVVIEKDPERKALAEEIGCLVLHANATDEQTLIDAHIDRARCLATVLPVDADNVFITLSARNLNPKLQIYARGEVPTTEPKLRQAGADHVVLPATIGGIRMAHMIVRPAASHLLSSLANAENLNADLEQLGVRMSELRVQADSALVGRTVQEIEIGGTGAYLIVAVRRVDGTLVSNPHPNTLLEAEDSVIVMGHGTTLPRMTLGPTPAREIFAPPLAATDEA